MNNSNDNISKYGRHLNGQKNAAVAEARHAIEEARKELDRVEAELNLAADDQPYNRVGRINQIDASAIFAAFGLIEQVAVFENLSDN